MNPEYNDIELIERYLEGKLSAEELTAFEKRIQEDLSFAQQLEAQKMSNAILDDYEFVQLKKQMQLQMRLESPSSGKKGGNNRNYLFFIGAAIIIGLSAYFILKDNEGNISSTSDFLLRNQGEESVVDKNEKPSNRTSDDSIIIEKNKSITLANIDSVKTGINTTSNGIIVKDTTIVKSIIVENKDSVSKQIDCSTLIIENTIEKEDACEGKNNGYIKINVIKGGARPYKFKINTKNGFTSSDKFNFLSAGEYYLSIKESSGCIIQIKESVKIQEKVCKEPFSATFTPSQESVWKLPIELGESAEIKFYNKAGQLIHKISIQNGLPSEWNGINFKGEETHEGYYYVTIEKANGTLEYGYLTINR
jgi:hypothetical protein